MATDHALLYLTPDKRPPWTWEYWNGKQFWHPFDLYPKIFVQEPSEQQNLLELARFSNKKEDVQVAYHPAMKSPTQGSTEVARMEIDREQSRQDWTTKINQKNWSITSEHTGKEKGKKKSARTTQIIAIILELPYEEPFPSFIFSFFSPYPWITICHERCNLFKVLITCPRTTMAIL